MPATNHYSFFLEVGFALAFRADVELGYHNDMGSAQTKPVPSRIDTTEAELSPKGQKMQRLARGRSKRQQQEEVEADLDSLNLLEAATAANTDQAKQKDIESLTVLLRHTHRAQKPRMPYQLLRTPEQKGFWPAGRYKRQLKESPLSFEPPFSTPSNIEDYEARCSSGEFEGLFSKDFAVSASNSTHSSDKRGNSFHALLEASKSSHKSTGVSAVERSRHIKEQAEALTGLMKMVEVKDKEDERILKRNLAEAMESPVASLASPTSQIKHLPQRTVGSAKGSSERMEGIEDDGWASIPRRSSKASHKLPESAPKPNFQRSSDADEERQMVEQ